MTYAFCGIDVAKYEHVASVYNPQSGELLIDSLHFENNDKGFKTLFSALSMLNKSYEILIGFESTSHYHQTLFNYLTDKKFRCFLINPYMTSRFRSISLRDAKNDNIDSRAIAQFLSFEYKQLLSEEFYNNELKELCIQRNELIVKSSRLKIQLKAYLDRTFPELCSIVDIHTNAIRAILLQYPTANQISHARIDHLKNLAASASKKKYGSDKVEKVKLLSKTSVGIDSAALGLRIIQAIESLVITEKQIDTINHEIISHPVVCASPLHKIKGLNSIEIAYIMSAIISIAHFDSAKKLVAYAGLDPKIRQSGTWQASSTRMSKRGSKLLRYALIWASYNMTRREGAFKSYYQKKRNEGKSHYNALGHCASKLCRYIFWLLNNPDKDFVMD